MGEGWTIVQKIVCTKLLRCIKYNLLKKIESADSIEPKFVTLRFLDPEKFNNYYRSAHCLLYLDYMCCETKTTGWIFPKFSHMRPDTEIYIICKNWMNRIKTFGFI